MRETARKTDDPFLNIRKATASLLERREAICVGEENFIENLAAFHWLIDLKTRVGVYINKST